MLPGDVIGRSASEHFAQRDQTTTRRFFAPHIC